MLTWTRRKQGNGWVYYCDNPAYYQMPVPFLYKIVRPGRNAGFQGYIMKRSSEPYETGEVRYHWTQLGFGCYSLKAAKEHCNADFKRRGWVPTYPPIDNPPF